MAPSFKRHDFVMENRWPIINFLSNIDPSPPREKKMSTAYFQRMKFELKCVRRLMTSDQNNFFRGSNFSRSKC